jgi:ABC-type phosphate transport system auxiliary subunit
VTTVAVGSAPVPGVPDWMPKALGYLGGGMGLLAGGVALYGLLKGQKDKTMTALEKTFSKLVMQLLQHIETLEREIEQSVRRSTYEEATKQNEVLALKVRNLQDANDSLARDNQERRSALSNTQERVRELEKRLDAKRKRR